MLTMNRVTRKATAQYSQKFGDTTEERSGGFGKLKNVVENIDFGLN